MLKKKYSTNYIAQNCKTQNTNSIIEEIEKETTYNNTNKTEKRRSKGNFEFKRI